MEPIFKQTLGLGTGMLLGLMLGAVYSVIFENVAFIGVGIAIGMALGAAFYMQKDKKPDPKLKKLLTILFLAGVIAFIAGLAVFLL